MRILFGFPCAYQSPDKAADEGACQYRAKECANTILLYHYT
ncbi:MAG: hypothetical protein P8Z00_04100 [Anaerolineales bacterium]